MMSTTTEAIFHDQARKLNSDLGKHVRKCSFSTNLNGRFYKNGSMESHKARARRVVQMKAKRKQLEKSLTLEVKKIRYLEERIRLKKEEQEREKTLRLLMEWSVTRIQVYVRRMQAIKCLEVMRVEYAIQNHIALFLQCHYRGWRDRENVRYLRMELARHRKEIFSAIKIQSMWRKISAEKELKKRRKKLQDVHEKSATRIQAYARGWRSRILVMQMKQNNAAIRLQCMFRTREALRICNSKRITKKKSEMPKRIPLHERRYSTYGAIPNAAILAGMANGGGGRRASGGKNPRRVTEMINMVTAVNEIRRRASLRGLNAVRRAAEEESGQRRHTSAGESVSSSTSGLTPQSTIESMDTSSQSTNTTTGRRTASSTQFTPNKHAIIKEEDAESITTAASATTSDAEKRIRRSRQQAAIRAAKLKKEKQLEMEKEEKAAQARKDILGRLESKRRSLMEEEREMMKGKKKNIKARRDITSSKTKNGDHSSKENIPVGPGTKEGGKLGRVLVKSFEGSSCARRDEGSKTSITLKHNEFSQDENDSEESFFTNTCDHIDCKKDALLQFECHGQKKSSTRTHTSSLQEIAIDLVTMDEEEFEEYCEEKEEDLF